MHAEDLQLFAAVCPPLSAGPTRPAVEIGLNRTTIPYNDLIYPLADSHHLDSQLVP